jgi:imidazoleglycerol-phosphate dehydratase
MRTAEVRRDTAETKIRVEVDLDGTGRQPARHRRAVSSTTCSTRSPATAGRPRGRGAGDLHIDAHHTVEDIGITLGQASPRRSATRRASAATATPTCRSTRRCRAWWSTLSGRPGLQMHVPFTRAMIGEFDVDLVHEFFQGFVNHAQVTLHVDNLRGDNAHHQCETVFKAFARALRMAVEPDPRAAGTMPVHQGQPVAACPCNRASARPLRSEPDDRFACTCDAHRVHESDDRVVDYGMGNLRSVAKALEHVAPKETVRISSAQPRSTRLTASSSRGRARCPTACSTCVTPGSNRRCARGGRTKPLLAVCVGEQMLFDWSEESRVPGERTSGLGLFRGGWCASVTGPAATRRSAPEGAAHGLEPRAADRAAPAVAGRGRRQLVLFRAQLLRGRPEQATLTAGTAEYGQAFTCVVAADNIFATQFHPEKSAAAGLAIYENFTRWKP